MPKIMDHRCGFFGLKAIRLGTLEVHVAVPGQEWVF